MLTHIYLRKGTVYLPTVARVEAGYYLDIEPVRAISASDSAGLKDAIVEAICKENQTVPTPSRAAFPKAVLLNYAKVKSWSAFEQGAVFWSIEESAGNFRIRPGRKPADERGWEDDPERIESFPSGTTPDTVAQRLVSLVQLVLEQASA